MKSRSASDAETEHAAGNRLVEGIVAAIAGRQDREIEEGVGSVSIKEPVSTPELKCKIAHAVGKQCDPAAAAPDLAEDRVSREKKVMMAAPEFCAVPRSAL